MSDVAKAAHMYRKVQGVQEQVQKHLDSIDALYRDLGILGHNGTGQVSPAAEEKGEGEKKPKGQRSPRGELKKAVHKLLESGGPKTAAQVTTELLAGGFKTKSKRKTFYVTVFNLLRKDPALEKTADKSFKLK